MAKKSMLAKNDQRAVIVARYAARRVELKTIISDPTVDIDAKFAARDELNKMPRDASAVRLRNRGATTGRPRGYLRAFDLDRVDFRRKALEGEIPGVRKASW
jgi:small subunit ribosomal protein S14